METFIAALIGAGFTEFKLGQTNEQFTRRVTFTVGAFTLSLVTGPEAYSTAGAVELAVIRDGEFCTQFISDLTSDDVLGQATVEQVLAIASACAQA